MIGLPIFTPSLGSRVFSAETASAGGDIIDHRQDLAAAAGADNDEIVSICILDKANLRIRLSNKSNLETGGSVWKASWLLSHYFAINPSMVKDKVVFELGSGSGLCGLCTAFFGARRVFLTDLDVQVPLLQQNVALNLIKLPPIISSTFDKLPSIAAKSSNLTSLEGATAIEGECNCNVLVREFPFGSVLKSRTKTQADVTNVDNIHVDSFTTSTTTTTAAAGIIDNDSDNDEEENEKKYSSGMKSKQTSDAQIEVEIEIDDIDLILGCDIGYDFSLHEPIITSLKSLAPRLGPTGKIYLVEEIRWKDVFEWYKTAIFQAFGGDYRVYVLDMSKRGTTVAEPRIAAIIESLDKPIEIIVIEWK